MADELKNVSEVVEKYKTHINRYIVVMSKSRENWEKIFPEAAALGNDANRVLELLKKQIDIEAQLAECIDSFCNDFTEYSRAYSLDVQDLILSVTNKNAK